MKDHDQYVLQDVAEKMEAVYPLVIKMAKDNLKIALRDPIDPQTVYQTKTVFGLTDWLFLGGVAVVVAAAFFLDL